VRVYAHTPVPMFYAATGAATTTLAVAFGVFLGRQGVWMSAGFAFFFAAFLAFFTVVTTRFGWMVATPDGITRGVGLRRGRFVPWAEVEAFTTEDERFELRLSGDRVMRYSRRWVGADAFGAVVRGQLLARE
jgi:hypothetical protein